MNSLSGLNQGRQKTLALTTNATKLNSTSTFIINGIKASNDLIEKTNNTYVSFNVGDVLSITSVPDITYIHLNKSTEIILEVYSPLEFQCKTSFLGRT
jgi:hypothetical protein